MSAGVKRLLKYLITSAIAAAVAVPLYFARLGAYDAEMYIAFGRLDAALQKYGAASDALFAAAVLILGSGLLVWASNAGMFDGIGYLARRTVLLFTPDYEKRRHAEKSYYEYKKAKHGTKASFGFLIIVGAVLLAGAGVCGLLYSGRWNALAAMLN